MLHVPVPGMVRDFRNLTCEPDTETASIEQLLTIRPELFLT